jgi:hypothetical protein
MPSAPDRPKMGIYFALLNEVKTMVMYNNVTIDGTADYLNKHNLDPMVTIYLHILLLKILEYLNITLIYIHYSSKGSNYAPKRRASTCVLYV